MLAVVGATGYTGRLIVRELSSRRERFVTIGRNREKLDGLEGASDRRVADASDARQVADALDGCTAAVSCVGPFVDHGLPTLEACVRAGVHYIDTTGEQPFIRTAFERFADAPVAVVPAVGFDYVPGDMAAALAARALGRAPDRIDVAYLVTKARSSDGTKRTGLRIASMPCLAAEDGRLVERRIGSEERRFAFPEPYGEANVALWPGGEPVTVPRHTGARTVRTFMRMPKVAAAAARTAGLASPVLRAGRSVVGSATGGPSDAERARARFCVVADADGARCVVQGTDMYGMTAAACAEALQRMSSGAFAGCGALAPSEAFEPDTFLDALSTWLSWGVWGVGERGVGERSE